MFNTTPKTTNDLNKCTATSNEEVDLMIQVKQK